MQSMTGFATHESEIGGVRYAFELKSVNHRYLETRFRLPYSLSALEIPLGQALRKYFSRGHIEIFLRVHAATKALSLTRFMIDEAAAESFVNCCKELNEKYKLKDTLSLALLASTRGIIVGQEEEDPSAKLAPLEECFDKALKKLEMARRKEGTEIANVLKAENKKLGTLAEKLKKIAPKQPKEIEKKLSQRISEWQLSKKVDSQRLEWEVALYADRSDFTEELDRLNCHIKEFADLLNKNEAIGRKLDFMTQEMHRELSTMGAKTTLNEITQLVVEAKAAVEKLRQQVQNVE